MRNSLIALFALAAACGDGPPVVSLGAAGASPTTLSVASGGQVHFVNSDGVPHSITSSDCPELASPTMAAGGSFTATLGSGPKSCAFADGLQPLAAAFQGTLQVGAAPSGGGGGGGYGY